MSPAICAIFREPISKTSLGADLERKTMEIAKAVTLRPGFRTITPYLLPPGPELIEFLKRIFDAEETERTETGPGRFHAEVRIGDSMLMIGVGSGRSMPATSIIYVKNADETYRRALEAGATSLYEM
jgi:PhnB protein